MKRSTIIVLTICFLISDLHHACAEEKSNSSDIYRARYIISGYLVRAGAVCENDVNRMIELGLQFISSAELKSIAKAFPGTTERWMTEGAERFNSEVVKGGITSACNSALATSKQAAGAVQIAREEPSDETAANRASQIAWMRLTDSLTRLATTLYSVIPGGRWGFLLIVISLYFLPITIAINRNHHNAKAIGALNLLLGWTIFGWFFAFVWACTRRSVVYRDVRVRREPHL